MNRARRESLNCLNADKETLEFFAAQEQSRPSPIVSHEEKFPGSGGPSGRNRSKSLAYGLTWAQAMNGRAVTPADMFGINNADDSSWQGPWVNNNSAGSASSGGGGGSGAGVAGEAGEGGGDPHRLHHHQGTLLDSGLGGGGGSIGAPVGNSSKTISGINAALSTIPPTVGIMPETPKLATMTWESTLEKSIRSIVSITANHVRSFDTETSGTFSFFVVQKHVLFMHGLEILSSPSLFFFLWSSPIAQKEWLLWLLGGLWAMDGGATNNDRVRRHNNKGLNCNLKGLDPNATVQRQKNNPTDQRKIAMITSKQQPYDNQRHGYT